MQFGMPERRGCTDPWLWGTPGPPRPDLGGNPEMKAGDPSTVEVGKDTQLSSLGFVQASVAMASWGVVAG